MSNKLLFEAIKKNDLQKCQSIISKGVDINAFCNDEKTPIYLSSQLNLIDMVYFFINKNADVNSPCTMGWTPLHIAARSENLNICMALIDHGANIEAKTDFGLTPLGLAAKFGKDKICLALMANSACPNQIISTDEDIDVILKMTPLHAAVHLGHSQLLLKCLNSDKKPQTLSTRVMQAIDVAKEIESLDMASLMQSWLARQAIVDLMAHDRSNLII